MFLESLVKEIDSRKDYLSDETIETVYFGGGTPSVLSPAEIGEIMLKLRGTFEFEGNPEITVEANPDDLDREYPERLLDAGINRISIGIQSFDDNDLIKMNRRHNARQGVQAVLHSAGSGFRNISIDLIYGIPGTSTGMWEKNIERAVQLPVNHISAYHLTYHEGTLFHRWLHKGTIQEVTEEESIRQNEILVQLLPGSGFEQYEISNFARNQAYSRHNCSYWTGKKYLGLGPSAHSFNGTSREWNISDIDSYILSIQAEKPAFESETLTSTDQINDYLITRIRTKWGISADYIRNNFGEKICADVIRSAGKYIETGYLKRVGDSIVLTSSGVMVSDQITRNLMVEALSPD
jgi:oxygen-independent coproporphyrinogen-3 oxidase